MTIFEVGRVCYKIAGRDAGKYCAVIKRIDSTYVEIDGQTRRRKCNISHLEPLDKTISIKENASSDVVAKALTELGFETKAKGAAKKTQGERPLKKRKVVEKIADVIETKTPKKSSKKE